MAANASLGERDARAFDHGVDFVAALGGLEGRWRTDYDQDLDARVGSADTIVIIDINTVHTDTDPEQKINHRLVGPVARVLLGDELKELELISHEDDPGYVTVHDNVPRFQGTSFIAYLKWYRGDSGKREAHFHLSPATEEIVQQTEARLTLRVGSAGGQHGESIVVHTN